MNKELALSLVNEMIDNNVIRFITNYFEEKDWPRTANISRPFRISRGCYKIVFIFDDCDFVIKTDYIDKWIEGTERDYGGCKDEYEMYQRICRDNMNRYFPETDFLVEEYGYKFYIQKRADVDECKTEDMIFESLRPEFDTDEDAQDYASSGEVLNSEILYAVFGEIDGGVLENYLDMLDITDIHSGNIGYYNDCPLIIDFAC